MNCVDAIVIYHATITEWRISEQENRLASVSVDDRFTSETLTLTEQVEGRY